MILREAKIPLRILNPKDLLSDLEANESRNSEPSSSFIHEVIRATGGGTIAKKILIVDDDPDIRQGLNLRLRANDYETCFAADAMSSIIEARKQTPDLIILDLGLPAGDGYLVMERLKAIPSLASVPVIIFSSRDPHLHEERVRAAGARAFFQKPVNNDELMERIRELLGEVPFRTLLDQKI